MNGDREEIIVKPIGVIHSGFTEEEGTPIQPALGKGESGWVEVFPEYEEALDGIEEFERVWLLFWCDKAGDFQMKVVPYMDNIPRGLFCTRSPARPNPIGLSCVRVTGRTGRRIEIAELDVLDGSPLLDIKPYVPGFDVFEVSRTGWVGKMPRSKKASKRFTR
jgi:tRNA-Thr(GGU) m(6)t(6)A37 methyltransferase TsaA